MNVELQQIWHLVLASGDFSIAFIHRFGST
jgi:hypothetical protein